MIIQVTGSFYTSFQFCLYIKGQEIKMIIQVIGSFYTSFEWPSCQCWTAGEDENVCLGRKVDDIIMT